MSVIGTILNSNGKQIVKDLQDSMKSKGLDASGKTSRSITYQVEESLTKATLRIMANRSIGALEFGRKAGKRPPRVDIEGWADSKPNVMNKGPKKLTRDQKVFLAQRKIGRDGIQVPNKHNPGGVITDVINDQLINKIFLQVKQASINRLVAATKKVKGGFAK